MKFLFIFLFFGLYAGAQTKTTITSLKGNSTAKTSTIYYTISGTDTSYWKRQIGNYVAGGNVIFGKNGVVFVKRIEGQLPIQPTVYKNTIQSFTATCSTGYTGTNTVTIAAGIYESNLSVSDANNKALAAAQSQAEAGLKCAANPPTFYANDVQNYTAVCTTGTGTNSAIVLAGTYTSEVSKDAANSLALSEAKKQAEGGLVCSFIPPAEHGLFNTKTSWGSIDAGSNILHLTQPFGIKAGEQLTVWLPSGKTRGTVGPGGVWPEKVYNTFKELFADTTRPEGSRAFALDTVGVYRVGGGNWYDESDRSFDKAVPFALYGATVLEIKDNGLTLILDTKAQKGVKNVRVTPDESNKLYKLIVDTRTFDAKDYGFTSKDTLWFGSFNGHWQYDDATRWRPYGIKIFGGGMVWASPPGSIPIGVGPENGQAQEGAYVRDLTLVQPGSYEGLGVYRPGLPNTGPVEDWLFEAAGFAGRTNVVTKFINCKVYNPVGYAFYDGHVDSCSAYLPDDNFHYYAYAGWVMKAFSDTISNSQVFANKIHTCFEIERGTNGAIINCTFQNGLGAMNASTNPLFLNNTQIFTKSAGVGRGNPPAFSINNRIGNGSGQGSHIIGHKIIQQDFVLGEGTNMRAFEMDGAAFVTMKDIYVEAPNMTVPWSGNGYGAVIKGGGDDLLIDGLTVVNHKMALDVTCEHATWDYTQFDMRGERQVIKNLKGAQHLVVRTDAVLQNVQADCPIKRKDSY